MSVSASGIRSASVGVGVGVGAIIRYAQQQWRRRGRLERACVTRERERE